MLWPKPPQKPAASDETYRATAAWTDLLLLRQFDTDGGALDAGLEVGMTQRQLAMQRLLQGRWDEALALLPNAFCHWRIGVSAYEAGRYEDAVEHLQAGYDLAARADSTCCSCRRASYRALTLP